MPRHWWSTDILRCRPPVGITAELNSSHERVLLMVDACGLPFPHAIGYDFVAPRAICTGISLLITFHDDARFLGRLFTRRQAPPGSRFLPYFCLGHLSPLRRLVGAGEGMVNTAAAKMPPYGHSSTRGFYAPRNDFQGFLAHFRRRAKFHRAAKREVTDAFSS